MSAPAAATEFCNQGDRCVLQQMQEHYALAKGGRLLCWKSSCIFGTAANMLMLSLRFMAKCKAAGAFVATLS